MHQNRSPYVTRNEDFVGRSLQTLYSIEIPKSARAKFSILNSLFSTFHFQFSIFHFPLSTFHFPLSIFHFPLSIFHFPLSIFHFPLSTSKKIIQHLVNQFRSHEIRICKTFSRGEFYNIKANYIFLLSKQLQQLHCLVPVKAVGLGCSR
jgi:hypothetical protein